MRGRDTGAQERRGRSGENRGPGTEDCRARRQRGGYQLALKAGKITPANKEWALGYAKENPEGFAEYCLKAPAAPAGLDIKTVVGQGSADLTSTDIELCKAMGNDPKEVEAYKASKMKGEV